MYNGIGLPTPRGSGTNGYIQGNKAFIRAKKRSIDYQSEEEIKKSEKLMFREPNKDILEHERKRRIESKCFEMQDLMEEQGYDDKEIDEKVAEYREALTREEFGGKGVIGKTDDNKLFGSSTHVLAAATQQKNEQLKSALNIRSDFEDGSSFHKKIRLEAEKEKSEWIESASSSSSSSSATDSNDSKDNRISSSKHQTSRKHSSEKSKSRKKHKKSKKKSKKSSKKKKK